MFNLSFLNSVLLFGLLAGIIPILIHLFVKYRPKIVYFSSLRFLKQIQKNRARVIKLREILLLLTRILIILFLIFALSRPVMKTILKKSSPTHAPTVAVIIIDNSFSMNYLDNDETLLRKAKIIAFDILEMLNSKDKIMLQTMNSTYNSRNSYFARPFAIKQQIEKIAITDNSQSLSSVLSDIEKKLTQEDVINKEIYFLTDRQKHNWKDVEKFKNKIQTDLFIIPILTKNKKSNLSVISANFVPKILTEKGRSEIRTNVKNFSDKKVKTAIISLSINNITQAEKAISLRPFQTKQVVFEFQNQNTKFLFGNINVKDDILPDDNNFYFNFSQMELPKIVIISEKNPSFQFSTALDLITENSWQKISSQEISDEIIEKNNLFIFLELNEFSEKLKYFSEKILKSEKSIFLIPNEKMAENNFLKLWLNENGIKFLDLSTQNSKINFINKLHPISAIFNKEMFEKTRIRNFWNISADDFTLLFSNNFDAPIFLIKDRFLVSTIGFDENWSNLMFQTTFPVLLYNIGNYLGCKKAKLNNFSTGIPFEIPNFGKFECRLPDGQTIPILVQNEQNKFTQTDQQGHCFLIKNEELQKVYSFNSPRDESDLTTISEEKTKELMTEIPKIHFVSSADWKEKILTSRYGYEFWKIILWIVLGLAVFEMVLAYSGKSGKSDE
ncbi:MAG: BatA domain-containing protein [Candidatus Cloacimonetes bacterium]|nr:BatA domain-containing protein [Candidatus Cloacimonadota bacterium]